MSAYPKPPARRSRWNRPAFEQAPPRTGLWRLTFALPVIFSLLTKPGRHGPCLMGCLVTLGVNGYVVVDATSREGALEQAARFLRGLLRELRQVGNLPPALSIPARMRGPIGESWCRTDSLNIVVGADVTFAEGGIEPYLPVREARADCCDVTASVVCGDCPRWEEAARATALRRAAEGAA